MLLPISFFSLGFISTALQVILLRRMAASFGGHEMAWGITLACWFLWVAAGSYFGGKILPQNFPLRKTLAGGFFLLAISGLFILLAPLLARLILGLPPGQIVGIFPQTLAAFFITALPCLVLGGLFSFSARWAQEELGEDKFAGMLRVYWWEALGAAAGGLGSSLLFYGGMADGWILFILSFGGAVLAAGQLAAAGPRARIWRMTAAALIILFVFIGVTQGKNHLSQKQWGGHQLRAGISSIYGPIEVLGYQEQISFYQNGLLVFSYPDRLAAEEAVHYALLQHPRPQKVLLIGGGAGGALKEALKHPELELVYVELDPAFMEAARKNLPPEALELLSSPRLKIIYGDARPYLLRQKLPFDVIMLNLPGPANAQLNRYYTEEFFRTLRARLSPTGIFFFKAAAAEDYWSPNLLRYLNTLRHTLQNNFAEVLVVPGESALYFAAPRPGILTADINILSRRYQERNLNNQFVNPQLLPFRFRADRIRELKAKLDLAPYAVNRDLHPISYLYDSILWSAQFGGWEPRIMGALSQIKLPWWWLFSLSLPLVLFLLLRATNDKGQTASYLCLFANGLTTIALEIILLLAFQVYYGYVHFLLGLLIALFMMGLSLGALGGRRYAARLFTGKNRNNLIFLQGMLLSMPVFLWLLFGGIRAGGPAVGGVLSFTLYLMMLLVGMAGGLHFTGFAHLLLAPGNNAEENQNPANLGGPYAADLAGSALGALMISALFIPLLGIPTTLMLLAAFNLLTLVLLAFNTNTAKRRIA